MNDLPRHALSRIIAKYGRGICDSPKRVEALLRDLCGGNRREINIIMGALEERVAADLVAAGDSVPRDLLLARLAARLRDNLAYTPEAARWGVETWAVALGLASEAELQRGAKAAAADEAGAFAPPPAVGDSKPARPTPPGDRHPAPQPRRGAPSPPPPTRPQRSGPPPSTYSPPAPVPRRSPPATPPKVVLPAAPPPTATPPNQRPLPTPQPAPRRGLRLRGCLIIIALILVLVVAAIFAIPAVIVLLQEEQSRPSINEPRVR